MYPKIASVAGQSFPCNHFLNLRNIVEQSNDFWYRPSFNMAFSTNKCFQTLIFHSRRPRWEMPVKDRFLIGGMSSFRSSCKVTFQRQQATVQAVKTCSMQLWRSNRFKTINPNLKITAGQFLWSILTTNSERAKTLGYQDTKYESQWTLNTSSQH